MQELTKAGVPRFPAFVRVRHDMDRADFLASGALRYGPLLLSSDVASHARAGCGAGSRRKPAG
jgi:hypothetical protein